MKRTIRLAGLAVLSTVLGGCATSAVITQYAERPAAVTFDTANSKPLQFKKVVLKLNRGQHIGAVQVGLACLGNAELTYKGGRANFDSAEFNEVFIEEVEKAGLKTVGNPDALFEDPAAAQAEILVAGTVETLKANFCYPMAGFGNFTDSKGEAEMAVDWQIYSKLDRRVVYQVKTSGSYVGKDSQAEGALNSVMFAFAQATRALLADPEFTKLLKTSGQLLATNDAKIYNETLALNAGSAKVVKSPKEFGLAVATVYAGNGHGSGFYISDQGHMLTNYHVVQDAKYIKVRGADGQEYLGEVLRRNPARDVALLKISNRPSHIFAMNDATPDAGDKVFAIGSPLDPALGATVSSGIVSSVRVSNNQRYIQSDVNVLPGNSGGPLTDANGLVIGMTTSGITLGGAPSGINLFGPSSDLKIALGVTLK